MAAIESALNSEPIDLRTGDTTPPDPVSLAGQTGVAVGTITRDRNNPQAAWLWIVTDNLRLRAENALLVAQELV